MSIQPEEIIKDEYGFWTHSQYPDLNEDDYQDHDDLKSAFNKWCDENKIKWQAVSFESDAPEALTEDWFDNNSMTCSAWNPTPPTDNAFLLSIHDTEDGPYAIFALPQDDGKV